MTTQGYPEDRPPTAEERRMFWDERYANEGWVFGLEPNQFVESEFADIPPAKILDLGCGQGRNSVWLASRGHDVTGIDLSPVAIEQAKELASEVGVSVKFEATDLTSWAGAPDSFDYVILSYLQLVPDQRRQVHSAARAVVRPGGTVFLIAHHLDNLTHGAGGPQLPDVLFTEDQLEDDFAGFEMRQLGPVERSFDREDGPATAIDILMVATKPQ